MFVPILMHSTPDLDLSIIVTNNLVRQSLNPSLETLVALPSHRAIAIGIPDRKNQTSNGPNECYIRSRVDFTPGDLPS